jgi:hypothetical protein
MENRSNTSGFLYHLHDLEMAVRNNEEIPQNLDTQVTDIIPTLELDRTCIQDEEYDNTDKTDDTITTNPKPYKVCYSSDSDIQALLQELWPSVVHYIETHPDHQHSIQWKTWMSQGLPVTSSLGQVKKIMGIETIAQLYLILRDSEAVNTYSHINWDHEIQYKKSNCRRTL